MPKATKQAKPDQVIIAYKGFDQSLSCRGFQFEVGKTYECEGEIKACENGFHACENPFDVWAYYDVVGSRFAAVELSGAMDRNNEDSKIASAKITITAELKLPEFIDRAIAWILNSTKGKNNSSGDSAQIGSSGYYAQIGSSGNSARIGSSGYYARIGSSGNSARIGSSGYYAQIGSSGDSARIGSSGDYARIGSSGNSARIGSSGDSARIEASGKNAVIASVGLNTSAAGVDGTWISLAEFNDRGDCIGFATGCIGHDGLKPNIPYHAKGGKLVEVQ